MAVLFAKTLLSTALLLAVNMAAAQSANEAEITLKLDQLTAELAVVKAQLAQIQQQHAARGVTIGAMAPGPDDASVVASASGPPPPPAEPATVITSYGELNYNRPIHDSQNAQADVRRFVLGYQHRFDETTKAVTELEVEHAVSSADDSGEVEVEQAFVERQLTPLLSARAGLFLMPVGLLNENHEPTAFYGVERNFVETAIIPSTWREGGVQLVANLDSGLSVQGGVSTGFDLSKWDATSAEGQASPLGAIHQELSLAKAHDLAVFGAVNWRGMPGLLLGGSLFSGGASQGQSPARSRVTLWDLHSRWTPGRWDLQALYARGTISDTAAQNAPLIGNPTLIPQSFDGGYVQGAYRLWSQGDYALAPFVRWERFNTARSYADLGPGLTPGAGTGERVITLGANLQVAQGIVVKADYQRFGEDAGLDRFDLGLGWSF